MRDVFAEDRGVSGSDGTRCPVCDDCPDLVAHSWCDACGNRAQREGRSRSYVAAKHGEPGHYVERDGTRTFPSCNIDRLLRHAPAGTPWVGEASGAKA